MRHYFAASIYQGTLITTTCRFPSTLAARALWSTLHSRDTEGYILLIALALLLQTTLTWITLRRRHQTRQT